MLKNETKKINYKKKFESTKLIKAKLIKKKYKTIFLIKLILNIELKKKKTKEKRTIKK
jgi:hypothetical protein